MTRLSFSLLSATILLLPAAARAAEPSKGAVEFNRDIRPILSDNCFACHGPDPGQRKAKLRLDTEEGALAKVIVPGKPGETEVLRRIGLADTESKRMPPVQFGKKLTAEQIDLLRRWVEQGAKWQKHWSLIAARKVDPPEVKDKAWAANPIDRFILARLEKEGLKPSPETDPRTLIRRLSFDLTGLPATAEEVEAFEKSAIRNSQSAIEELVDRLLASPHFGERMALHWLDLVRYADTAGYHSDNHRDVTPYRDYVINAFNSNKPFDRFTLEQLAGDLMPGATVEAKIGSGYNRLLQTTEEGGAQAKEYQAKYAADRVRNVASVWLGTTLGCCECHDHKFDPFPTKEFYRFASFFADVKEKAVGRQDQDRLATPEQAFKLEKLDASLAPLQKTLATATPELDAAQVEWEKKVKDPAAAKGIPKNVTDILAVEPAKRNEKQKEIVAQYFRGIAPQLEPVRKQIADLTRQKDEILKSVPSTLITTAVTPRLTRVLPRGNWLDDSGEVVKPGTPAALPPLTQAGDPERRATRLDLAHWLVSPAHPLTSRVFVNRLWKLMYGQGIVKSLEDFGAQGAWPTHPELLDWLAVEFAGEPGAPGRGEPGALAPGGWNIKKLIKLMALSQTYRQSSLASEQLRQRDPFNTLLARQARFRVDAEMVRDNALAVSGLLVRKVGGGNVKPYQPAGYWTLLNFPKREWQNDAGEDLYRRGLYTYWCRTFLHPSLATFDAPSREECTVERPRSNTPLQALVLLNDPSYVEAARVFAERIMKDGGADPLARVHFAFRQALQRKPTPEEAKLLATIFEKHRQQYQADRPAALAILQVGDKPAAKDLDAAELAAWTSVARVILNLHETITRN